MRYHRLTQMITYKALWEGIAVHKIRENNTARTCHKCGSVGNRLTQGLFQCLTCRLTYNADLNGAINLAKRFEGCMLSNGASFDNAQNSPYGWQVNR